MFLYPSLSGGLLLFHGSIEEVPLSAGGFLLKSDSIFSVPFMVTSATLPLGDG